jgi:hypothetical protein
VINTTLETNRVLDREALADLLKVSEQYLASAVGIGELKAHRVGKRELYVGSEILQWVMSRPAANGDRDHA